jgi:hypothetical protein
MSTLEQRINAALFQIGSDMKTALLAAGGGASTLDDLTDVTITTPATGHMLRYNGTVFANVDPTSVLQPLDSDLTAIAALATTSYGRALLTLADAAALTAALNTGTTALKGALQLASTAQTQTGTDTALATTAAGVKAAIDQRIDNTAGLSSGSTTNAPSVAAAKTYIDGIIAAANALVYKGVIDASANPNYPASNAGDVYKVSVAGKIGGASGPNVEVGDMLIALTDGTAAGTQAAVGAQWDIVQQNIDGAVTGPASSTSGNLPSFSGTTGKVVADSGFTPSNGAIGGGSATVLPTSAQVVAYAQPLDSDLTSIAALTTTAYGRAFLALANQAALMALIAAATETAAGIAEIATQTETNTGTDDARIVTPLKFQTRFTALVGNPDSDFLTTYTTARDS